MGIGLKADEQQQADYEAFKHNDASHEASAREYAVDVGEYNARFRTYDIDSDIDRLRWFFFSFFS